LRPEHGERGRAWLHKQGMADGSWFVCLHVRDPESYKEDVPWSTNRYRNAGVEDYLPAVRAITERGGWVVRVGDPMMSPISAVDRVIDYANMDAHEDWIDIFLMAAPRFFIGVSSGPFNVATAFGVPILGTNWFPLGPWPYSGNDMFIHKLLRRSGSETPMSIAESLVPPLFMAMSPFIFDEMGIEVIDNTADEVKVATIEMMDRLDGNIADSEEDERMQRAYIEKADPYRLGWRSRVGKHFLASHPELLGDNA